MSEEKQALTEFLDEQRRAVLAIVDGLPDDVLARNVEPFGWSPLGLVEHLGYAERHWLQDLLIGEADELPWPPGDPDLSPLETEHTPAEVFAFYAAVRARSDEIIAATPLDTAPKHPFEEPVLAAQTTDLRRILLHLIEETARHAGHLDLVRELLDGRTGLGPR